MTSTSTKDILARIKEQRTATEAKSKIQSRRALVEIENISPIVDCGRYPIKRVLGDTLRVQADVLKPGHDQVYALLKHRLQGNNEWVKSRLTYSYNEDRWSGSFSLDSIGLYEYCVEASTDRFATILSSVEKWAASGEDISADLNEIRKLLEQALTVADNDEKHVISEVISAIDERTLDLPSLIKKLEDPKLDDVINTRIDKKDQSSSAIFRVVVDPVKAVYSSWYEMFHRSQGTVQGKSATFSDCEKRLDDIKQMGFDVIYLPPVHPIGRTNRRGANNSLNAGTSDPGSPWAIGNKDGGHDAVNKELGTLDEFKHFVASAKEKGIVIALDLAYQCSPDHPYVTEHPEWFNHRNDGTIRYAENPPKRYYDIYPINFDTDNWQDLWQELARIVFFWIENGVRIFRVDNPHTKPTAFWEWLIREVKSRYPDTIFLSEAFTRPKSMMLLAKLGFTQSYTYFTWKNTKYELVDFLNEFVVSDASEYYRGNFFTNTPDILHEYLQTGGRPAFKIRLVLAATLSSVYGIYNGFELCENVPKTHGSEEYLDSEKYQYKVWDWNRPGNIKDYIGKVNQIRRDNPALHETHNLRILRSDNDSILFYGKWTEDKSNIILVAVNLTPTSGEASYVHVPIAELGIPPENVYAVRDLITGSEFAWRGEVNFVKLDPNVEPAHVLLLKR